MAMKKTSGGDSPLRQGVKKELLDPPDLRVDDDGGSRCVLEI
jgi:hypothetical protein